MAALKISQKLGIASLLFVVPIAYLIWALIGQQNIAIDFAGKEIAGTLYLRGLDGVQAELAKAVLAETNPVPPAERVRALETRYGEGMESAELAKQAGDALAAAGETRSAETLAAAQHSLRALIGRIGDKSNLILDPDLDSFYAMDLVLLKLPDLIDRVADMGVLSRRIWADGSIGNDEKVDFYLALGAIRSLGDGIDGSVASGYSGNADGSLKANLDASYQAAKQADLQFQQKVEKAAVDAAEAGKTLATLDRFYGIASAELERLLNRRIEGFVASQRLTLAITALLFLIAAGAVLSLVRVAVIRRLRRLTETMTALAGGALDTEVADGEARDEVGDMARAVAVFKSGLIKARELEEEHVRAEAARTARAERIDALTAGFEKSVAALADTLSSATSEMQRSARSIDAASETSARQSTAAAAASEQASGNVQTVASAADELTAAIDELGRQVDTASGVASEAAGESERTNKLVGSLAETASRIDTVTSLINEIAEQTNLLALNATIEAARAGEAGKGFAVVASEVKNLATQTARATEEIGTQIAAMQGVTGQTVEAIGSIGATITRINEIAATMAATVDQQGSATREIARSVQEAATGTRSATSNVEEVKQATGETRTAAGQVLTVADRLTGEAEALFREVEQFLAAVKAA
ncbi:Methyl-accepting chemotaxis protein [Tistlia consotensis]|uniref:Methyl-accepting chemotaxis protein n=1 Tax=Tistlia consotensis USBA 355 TaxID=560819 RepID=A0A1Y6CUT1_9PROT|nr:methyl-accepting chemotaxis protein [Tistlia consotensis]SMF79566.1 Methyl-accepting chemotaxis protein [Tistlia consotensis USBA 355]SNS16947.1 Methyl-accepting chemotaxis protein [Tistlia consotensis]